jgi:hypothetical protein
MPYDFTEYPPEPEAQPASSRGGGPPAKRIGIGFLDRPEVSPPNLARGLPRISFWLGIALLLGSLLVLFLTGLAPR